jgi:murein DD-endopeptidase MepM/ murein hydrolase activator NlpD
MHRSNLARVAPTLLVALGMAVTPALALAEEPAPILDGVVRLVCAESVDTAHPGSLLLRQQLFAAPFADEAERRLVVAYFGDPPNPAGRGRLRAVPRLRREDGSGRGLGTLSTRQNGSSGEARTARLSGVEVAAGDAIDWEVRLRGFPELAPGECFGVIVGLAPPPSECGPYPNPNSSEYSLPFSAGERYVISQGNCDIGTHRGPARYAYDIAMLIGTQILAARAGSVVAVDVSRPDGTGLFDDDNAVVIEHADGTLASYVHLTQGGSLVAVGQVVEQGEPIALSGNSGHTGGLPHLHFQVTPCPNRDACGTLPVTFRNAGANPDGLLVGKTYRAR